MKEVFVLIDDDGDPTRVFLSLKGAQAYCEKDASDNGPGCPLVWTRTEGDRVLYSDVKAWVMSQGPYPYFILIMGVRGDQGC